MSEREKKLAEKILTGYAALTPEKRAWVDGFSEGLIVSRPEAGEQKEPEVKQK